MDIDIKSLNNDITLFNNKEWINEKNKNLLTLIKELRLNISPETVYFLDSIGLNYLEIIHLNNVIGENLYTKKAIVTGCDIDHLYYLEDKFGIIFGPKYRLFKKDEDYIKKLLRCKIDSLCFKNKNTTILNLFNLKHKYKTKQKITS